MLDYYTRGTYDEWWGQEAANQEAHWRRHADVPTLIAGGWYDQFCGGSCRYFETLRRQNSAPTRLIVGPWNHGGMREDKSWAGEVDFGPESVFGGARYNRLRLRWFREWLGAPSARSADIQLTDEARVAADEDLEWPVEIFVMGTGSSQRTPEGRSLHGGEWWREREWPLARAVEHVLHLRGCSLSTEPLAAAGGGGAELPAAARSFTYDPADPVPSLGGAVIGGLMGLVPPEEGGPSVEDYRCVRDGDQFATWRANFKVNVAAGPMHQETRPGLFGCKPPYGLLCERADVLSYTTEPLASDLTVVGTPRVVLWVSSSAVDTDITVKLLDVSPPSADWPDGFHLNLQDTVLRMRYREGWERERLMDPSSGRPYRVEIAMWPLANVWKQGHSIRLDVSSSNFPRLDLNPNTGEPMGRHTHTVVALNTIHSSAEFPSQLLLPVVSAGADAGAPTTARTSRL